MTEGLALLRKPFPPHQISQRQQSKGGPMLSYVGHAALTDRLLDADPAWNWEPLALSPEGIPVIDPLGGMWIKLTVCGVTRLGYGDAGGKEGPNAIKEIIGDALRNAAMRFGAALDLWHKGDLHVGEPTAAPEPPQVDRTFVMKCRTAIQGHLAADRTLGALQEWESALERGEETAAGVWAGLTTPERDQVRALKRGGNG